MKTIHILYLCAALAIVIIAGWLIFLNTTPENEPVTKNPDIVPMPILSFADCQKAGNAVTGTSPRQCRTADGRVYAEEIAELPTYSNASADLIVVDLPQPGAVTGKEFSVMGKARGTWFFEASFPIGVVDENDVLIASGIAQAQGEWMTENFVPFKANIVVPETFIGKAKLILKKDNPSGLPENDASISIPFTIEY